MQLTVAFIMDPMEGITVASDTSFAFMLAAHARGMRVVHVNPSDVTLDGRDVVLKGRVVEVRDSQSDAYTVLTEERFAARDCAAIFVRTDPPFDEAYLTVTWILSFAEEQGVRIINSPRGLRTANEHLYSLFFPDLCPETLVTSQRTDVERFVREVGGVAIAKPIDGHAGFGVVRLTQGDTNFNALVDMLTIEGRQPVMVQRYLPEAVQGDRRLVVIDGVLRAGIQRVPAAGDNRANVHVGGEVSAIELSAADRQVAEAMGDRLRADGLYFVGLDVIGDKLIEVNVTSPTLLREIRRLGGPDLADEVIADVQLRAGTAGEGPSASVAH